MSLLEVLYTNPWLFFLLMQSPAFLLIALDIILALVFVGPHFFSQFHVIIYEHRGEKGLKVRKCYGTRKVDKNDGTEKIRLGWPLRCFIEYPDLNNLVPINGRQDLYCVYRDTSGNFRPFSPLELDEQLKNIKLVVEDKDVARWAQQERKQVMSRLLKKDEHWIKQYWPQIGLVFVFMLSIMCLIFVGYYSTGMVEKGMGAAAGQTNKMLDAGNNYAKIILFAMGETVPKGNILLNTAGDPVQEINTSTGGSSSNTFGLLPT